MSSGETKFAHARLEPEEPGLVPIRLMLPTFQVGGTHTIAYDCVLASHVLVLKLRTLFLPARKPTISDFRGGPLGHIGPASCTTGFGRSLAAETSKPRATGPKEVWQGTQGTCVEPDLSWQINRGVST